MPLVSAMGAIIDQIKLNPADLRCVLVVSAHWETQHSRELRVTAPLAARHPELLYDYSGFPDYTYQLKYDCPAAPDVAEHVRELVAAAGFECCLDRERNLDHGVFVPLSLMLPDASVPVVQLSLPAVTRSGHDNAERCLLLGRALSELRDQGVLIVASGSGTHGRFSKAEHAAEFMDALKAATIELEGDKRWGALAAWEDWPHAREAHAREEHLLPLHVVAGASEDSAATVLSDEWWRGSLAMTHIAFGA